MQGGPGSKGSHFEYRLFQGEAMVATVAFSPAGARAQRLPAAADDDSAAS
jgi:hypothetical protein